MNKVSDNALDRYNTPYDKGLEAITFVHLASKIIMLDNACCCGRSIYNSKEDSVAEGTLSAYLNGMSSLRLVRLYVSMCIP